ncbi:hypothetical protein NH340_JMT06910 [Sarcoptes scabiei]|nr:hypothetical protein NH340_JMT06910 [Sarcoptes scabiei]
MFSVSKSLHNRIIVRSIIYKIDGWRKAISSSHSKFPLFHFDSLCIVRNDPIRTNFLFSIKSIQSSSSKNDSILISSDKKEGDNSIRDNKASESQLQDLSTLLSRSLVKFFKEPHNFLIYSRDVIFEDNIRNVKTVGINAYAWQITKIKVGAHLKYAKLVFKILKMTQHPEESCIKIRWRIIAYPGNFILFPFWKTKLWDLRASIEKDEYWIDGFSVLSVGNDGLIFKIVCDQVMPDSDKRESTEKNVLATKLGVNI